jgi:dienelactone hydrolase
LSDFPRAAVALILLVLSGPVLAGCAGNGVSLAPAASLGPQGGEAAPSRRQLWLVPSAEPGLAMRAHLYRPPGPGPFRLAIVAHGSEQDARLRAAMAMPRFDALTAWLVERGYAVLVPQRPGHGETGGPYLEDQGGCASADFRAAGFAAADSIQAALGFMAAQPFVEKAGAVVVGNSAGGWGALALASRNPAQVAAIVNFSGGRGGHDRDRPLRNCAPERLVAAAGDYGRTARLPTLWLYAANDTYFPPDLSGRMAEAFRRAGGRVEYRLLPAVAGDGHALIQTEGAAAAWKPYLERFLAARP